MIFRKRRQLLIFALYLQALQEIVFGTGYFLLKLQTFYNTADELWDGGDCEGWGGTCDNMFEICVKQYPPLPLGMGSCLYYKKATERVEGTSVNFQTRSTGIPRSIRINVNKYTGAGFFMRIMDYDSVSSSDHVDDHAYGEALTPGSNGNAIVYSRKIWGRRSSDKSWLTFTVTVSCDQYYYSSTCERYCKPNDDNNGHYTCSSHGLHVCRTHWFVLPNCLVYCAPQNDNVNGHYTCDSRGNHVCRTNWFNLPKCNTFCEPKDDDVNGHYVCSNDGSRVCRSGWYTEPTCLTYCVPQDDDINGHYTCSSNGSRICRTGWHNAPDCLTYCVPQDDDVNGHYTCASNGSRICRPGWFLEPNCNRFCQPQDNIDGRYTCDNKGYRVCRKNWHGLPNCTTFCEEKPPQISGNLYQGNCTENGNVTVNCTGNDNCTANCIDNDNCTTRANSANNGTCLVTRFNITDNKPLNDTTCKVFCEPQDDKYGHFGCSSNGSRICRPNWFNLPNCTTFCEDKSDISGHLSCTSNGTQICSKYWYNFPNCTTFCEPHNDSINGHYSCEKDGSRFCLENWYNLPNCTSFCRPRNDASGHYTCASNGSHICNSNWYEAPNCTKFCKPQNDSNGHYTCSGNGSRICRENWYNLPNCTKFCFPRDDNEGHYTCDFKGNIICNDGWYGTGINTCNKYCVPLRNDTLGYYNCSDNGDKICLENWYGSDCLKYCKISSKNGSHFACNSTGDVVCKENYYGDKCKVYCVPQDDDDGHFDCDNNTGNRTCSFGWTGVFCNVSLNSILRSRASLANAGRSTNIAPVSVTQTIAKQLSDSSIKSKFNPAASSEIYIRSTILHATNTLSTAASRHMLSSSGIQKQGPRQTTVTSITYARHSAVFKSFSPTDKTTSKLQQSTLRSSIMINAQSRPLYSSFTQSNLPKKTRRIYETESNIRASKSSMLPDFGKASSVISSGACKTCSVHHSHHSRLESKSIPVFKTSSLQSITPVSSALDFKSSKSSDNKVLITSSSRNASKGNTVTIVKILSTPTKDPSEKTKDEKSDVMDWLINTNEGKTVLSGSVIALLLIILLIGAIYSYLRPVKPPKSKVIPFSNLETAGKRDSNISLNKETRFHSNKLYDLHIEKATMRGGSPWSFDNQGSDDEDIIAPSTPSVTYDRLVKRTDMAQRKVTIIPVKGNSITAYENPSRRLLFEESCI